MLRTQFEPSQVNPKGQHCPLHCDNGTVSAVVFKILSGWAVTFCKDMSQGMVCIVEQSLPVGQHRSVVFAASGTQVDVVGQQKLGGSEAWMQAHSEYVLSAQVEARSKSCAEARTGVGVESRKATSIACLDIRFCRIFSRSFEVEDFQVYQDSRI